MSKEERLKSVNKEVNTILNSYNSMEDKLAEFKSRLSGFANDLKVHALQNPKENKKLFNYANKLSKLGGNKRQSFMFQEHQKFVIDYMKEYGQRGLLIYHGLGSGKTITSIGIAELYPNKKVNVISPASIIDNIEDSFTTMKLSQDVYEKRYTVQSYQSLSNILKEDEEQNKYFKDRVVIIDEAHNLRNRNKMSNLIHHSINPKNKKEDTEISGKEICKSTVSKFNVYCHPKNLINSDNIMNEGTIRENKLFYKDASDVKMIKKNNYKKNYKSLDEECREIVNSIFKVCKYIRNDASKVILLTGTPMMNHPVDISRLINIITGEKTLSENEEEFEQQFISSEFRDVYNNSTNNMETVLVKEPKNMNVFKSLIYGLISYYIPDEPKLYPSSEEIWHKVEMDSEQFNKYKEVVENKLKMENLNLVREANSVEEDETNKSKFVVNTFLNKSRQIGNFYEGRESPTPKLKEMAEIISKGAKPVLVYSGFKENGIIALNNILTSDYNARTKIFSGDINVEQKNKIINQYNNYIDPDFPESDKFDVLLITSAGGEGLDLKNTRQVHIMEPHWNIYKINQAIGRAIRYKSHEDLPEEQRTVEVHKWISDLPNTKEAQDISLSNNKVSKVPMGADEKLYKMSDVKRKLIESFTKLIIESSIEKQRDNLPKYYHEQIKTLEKGIDELKYFIAKLKVLEDDSTILSQINRNKETLFRMLDNKKELENMIGYYENHNTSINVEVKQVGSSRETRRHNKEEYMKKYKRYLFKNKTWTNKYNEINFASGVY